jgi:hypothetical protein
MYEHSASVTDETIGVDNAPSIMEADDGPS